MDNIVKEDFSLSKEIFNIKVNTQAIFDTIMSERASKRQGTHKTKTRGEVRGGGKKPFAQKHTGRARAGSTRSPIWVGGGTVFGPTNNKNYNLKVNKKVKKLAYKSALTLKAKSNSISLINISIDKISTKNLIQNLKDNKINTNKKILILSSDEILFKSSNNLKNIVVQKTSGLLVEQIIHADILIFSKNNLQELERFSK